MFMLLGKRPIQITFVSNMASFTRFLFLAWLGVFMACRLPLHTQFDHTKAVPNYSLHLINDSARWSMTVPGDVVVLEKPRSIKRELKRFGLRTAALRELDGIALAACTREEPFYAFVVCLSDSLLHWPDSLNVARFTRALDHGFATAFAHELPQQRRVSMIRDLEQSMKTLRNGASYRSSIVTPLDVFDRFKADTRFAECFEALKAFPPADDAEAQLKFQLMLTEASFLEHHPDYQGMLSRFVGARSPNDVVAGFFRKSALFENDALSFIVERAADAQITLINEQHVIPRHRELVRRLLEPLQNAGYTHLALEALKPGADSALNAGAVLTTAHGYYTKEQVFGNLIREAQTLGFTFVAYEAPTDEPDREAWQANRLAAVVKNNPNAKVIALVGVDHLLEDPMPDGKQWMASHLKHRHGIDPFTVDQIRMERYSTDFDCGLASAERFASDDKFDRVDAAVLNKLTPSPCKGCVDTLFNNSESYPVQINVYALSEWEAIIETANPVPVIALYLQAGASASSSIPQKNKIEIVPIKQAQ